MQILAGAGFDTNIVLQRSPPPTHLTFLYQVNIYRLNATTLQCKNNKRTKNNNNANSEIYNVLKVARFVSKGDQKNVY